MTDTFVTTETVIGSRLYETCEVMHNIKSVKIGNKEVKFKVLLEVEEEPIEIEEMKCTLKTLKIEHKNK